ncbi:hypothetical protein H5410_046943 [Solanum commersonii]|uniref:Uncharacterized protein n=1 Tax=Solanum commersonii TaxID=4109 RepID=A0A9J5XFP4_SOLCO|nr:hypothetical protein H5410_046943 [Solanum commersonii]
MHLTRCHEMVKFEFVLATLKDKISKSQEWHNNLVLKKKLWFTMTNTYSYLFELQRTTILVVDYGPEKINALYGLLDHNIEAFKAKDCKSGTWIASKLCVGNNVPWATTKLCKWAEVEVYLGGTQNQIFPLKMQAEGTMVKIKKRKIDVGKSVQVEEDFPIPTILGPYESLASELKNGKEIMTKLPQG